MDAVEKTKQRIYARNNVQPPKTQKQHYQERINKNKEYILEYLKNNPCAHCGESNILTLEFDHIDRDSKTKTISRLMGGGLNKIKEELKRCQVLCGSCHNIKTHIESNSWRFQELSK